MTDPTQSVAPLGVRAAPSAGSEVAVSLPAGLAFRAALAAAHEVCGRPPPQARSRHSDDRLDQAPAGPPHARGSALVDVGAQGAPPASGFAAAAIETGSSSPVAGFGTAGADAVISARLWPQSTGHLEADAVGLGAGQGGAIAVGVLGDPASADSIVQATPRAAASLGPAPESGMIGGDHVAVRLGDGHGGLTRVEAVVQPDGSVALALTAEDEARPSVEEALDELRRRLAISGVWVSAVTVAGLVQERS